MGAHKYIGVPLPRREDMRVLLGSGTYLADLRVPGALDCAFIRSPYPHARVRGVSDSTEGTRLYLWEDMESEVAPLPAISRPKGSLFPRVPALANGKVRFAGDPAGVVVNSYSSNRYRLQDELERVEVEYE